MAFRTGAYATIWEVKPVTGNFTDVRLSTSKKNKQTDQYETDFSGFVRLIGTAHQMASSLGEKSKIKIGDCEVSNHYDKDKKVTYTNFAIFSFENADGGNQTAKPNTKPADTSFMDIPAGSDESLPFE